MNKYIAFVFPGQGSQSQGMLKNFYATYSIIQETFAQASHVLGYDVWALIQNGPLEHLNQTEITQPVLLTCSVALWRLWQNKKGRLPVVLAGHSLGEYSALVCADALPFEQALHIVTQRGRWMQEAVPKGKGAMAAIVGLTDEQVQVLCEQVKGQEILAPANFNAPGQVVVAGQHLAVERLMAQAKNAGAKLVKKLDVSVPSHCELMQSAADQLHPLLENTHWQFPAIPVVQNDTASYYNDLPTIRQALYRQLFSPVRWVECVQKMANAFAITHIVECGPGKILTGLNKRIISLPVYSIGTTVEEFEEVLNLCST